MAAHPTILLDRTRPPAVPNVPTWVKGVTRTTLEELPEVLNPRCVWHHSRTVPGGRGGQGTAMCCPPPHVDGTYPSRPRFTVGCFTSIVFDHPQFPPGHDRNMLTPRTGPSALGSPAPMRAQSDPAASNGVDVGWSAGQERAGR